MKKSMKNIFHMDKRNFELIGYSVHNTDFLALVKVLLTYICRCLAKCSSFSFYSACGYTGLKQIRKFFFQRKAHVYSLLGQTEGKRKIFSGRGKKGWCRLRLPQIALSFLWDWKCLSFLENWIIPPPCLLFIRTPYNYVLCR